jgi:hypothetical protein
VLAQERKERQEKRKESIFGPFGPIKTCLSSRPSRTLRFNPFSIGTFADLARWGFYPDTHGRARTIMDRQNFTARKPATNQ